jgi:hypothetical protein
LAFKHDDGSEITPVSLKDFYAKGMDKLDKYVMNNKPTNDVEKQYRDSLRSQKITEIERQLSELRDLDGTGDYPRTQSTLTEYASNKDTVIE